MAALKYNLDSTFPNVTMRSDGGLEAYGLQGAEVVFPDGRRCDLESLVVLSNQSVEEAIFASLWGSGAVLSKRPRLQ